MGGTSCKGVVEDVQTTLFAEPQGVPPIQNLNPARRVILTRRAVFIDTARTGRTSVALPRILPHVQVLASARRWRKQGARSGEHGVRKYSLSSLPAPRSLLYPLHPCWQAPRWQLPLRRSARPAPPFRRHWKPISAKSTKRRCSTARKRRSSPR